ncbi:hypothetical protein V8D89_006392 [Ganoderma adspersum]
MSINLLAASYTQINGRQRLWMCGMSAGDESRPSDLQTVDSLQVGVPSNDTPFTILPPELLVKILFDVYVLIRKNGIPWDSNWTIPYQLVCRRWRDVICSTPQLWQEICVCSSPRWLDFCLTRCAGAPAKVLVSRPLWVDETYATLRRHASSIRECHIHSHVADLEMGFPSLLATPMPALELLSVDGVAYYIDEPANIPIIHDLFPRLTSLDLRNCTPPLDAAVYASLRNLRLVSCYWASSYDEFLGVMGGCYDLEFLSLDEAMLNSLIDTEVENPMVGQLVPNLPVVLARLRCLKLSGPPKVLFQFLTNIHAPQATRIGLTNCFEDEDDPLLTRIFAPNPQLKFPFLSSSHTISLSCWDETPFKLSVHGAPPTNALLSVFYGTPEPEDDSEDELRPENENLHPNLIAVMDIFPTASVDTLEVEGCLDQVAVETWQRVFQTFSNMRTLRLKGKGTLDPIWLGLSRATTASLEGDGTLCCPLLSEIDIDGGPDSLSMFSATVTLFEGIRAALSARAAAGGIRLTKLKLCLQYTRKLRKRIYRSGSGVLEGMRALVGELDYQDWRES